MSARERKIITVLFADLVGFTSTAEELDPEDVEKILRPYHERLRSEWWAAVEERDRKSDLLHERRSLEPAWEGVEPPRQPPSKGAP
jgi:hypothetical protein